MGNQLQNDLIENIKYFDEILMVNDSFDVIKRLFTTGGKMACLYFIDGFAKDEVLQKVIEKLDELKPEDFPLNANDYAKENIGYIECDLLEEPEEIIKNILSGTAVLLIDTYYKAIAIDARTYPTRSIEEPEKDCVLRGSHDGFVETIVFNTALIRRRIRSPKLINKMMEVGTDSKTDVVISYMEDRCNKKLLDMLVQKISSIDVDALSMNQESMAECLLPRNWWNPFPKFKFTERPDTAAACLLEGNILILVDNSPAAIIIPSSVFDIVEEANDYYFPPMTGSYLRISRLLMNLFAVILTPLFVVLMKQPNLIPEWLQFIKVKEAINVPIVWQFLILEFSVDGLKLASLNTPTMLSTPLSVIAALIIGDFAVSSGWFNAETMLYMAFVVLANYTQVNFEFGYALKFSRVLLLILSAIGGIWGFTIGIVIELLVCAQTKTIVGKNYIYPLIPFNWKKLSQKIFRFSIYQSKNNTHR